MSLTYRTTPPPKKKKIIINKVHQLCRLWNSGFPPTKRTTRENSVGRLSYSTREEAPKSPSFDYNRSKFSLEHRHRHRPKILLLKKCNLAPNIEPWRQASRAQKKTRKFERGAAVPTSSSGSSRSSIWWHYHSQRTTESRCSWLSHAGRSKSPRLGVTGGKH